MGGGRTFTYCGRNPSPACGPCVFNHGLGNMTLPTSQFSSRKTSSALCRGFHSLLLIFCRHFPPIWRHAAPWPAPESTLIQEISTSAALAEAYAYTCAVELRTKRMTVTWLAEQGNAISRDVILGSSEQWAENQEKVGRDQLERELAALPEQRNTTPALKYSPI